MILYNLKCRKGHVFETWFRDSAAYDLQAEAGVIECPVCGSTEVEKAIMAPRVARSAGRNRAVTQVQEEPAAKPALAATPEATPVAPVAVAGGAGTKAVRETAQSAKVRRVLQELRRHVEDNFDYVGPAFAEEARKIHYGETEERQIYGETSQEEAEELEEEGVSVRRIPWLPRENS